MLPTIESQLLRLPDVLIHQRNLWALWPCGPQHASNHKNQDGNGRHHAAGTPAGSALQPPLFGQALLFAVQFLLTPGQAGGEERPLSVVEGDSTFLTPPLRIAQPAAHVEVVLVVSRGFPPPCGVGQFPVAEQIIPVLLYPFPQPFPSGQERFVSDLDRGGAGNLVTVKREQTAAGKQFDHLLHRDHVDIERHQLGRVHPSPAPLVVLGDRHQSEEELLGHLLFGRVELVVELLSGAGQCTLHAADRPVGVDGEHVADPAVEQLGQCVLEHGQGAGLAEDVADQLGQQSRFQCYPASPGRFEGGGLQFIRSQRHDIDDPGSHSGPELSVFQGPAVEVCSQRDGHHYAPVGVVDGPDQLIEETFLHGVVLNESEELFELVYDQQQPRRLVGEKPESGS